MIPVIMATTFIIHPSTVTNPNILRYPNVPQKNAADAIHRGLIKSRTIPNAKEVHTVATLHNLTIEFPSDLPLGTLKLWMYRFNICPLIASAPPFKKAKIYAPMIHGLDLAALAIICPIFGLAGASAPS